MMNQQLKTTQNKKIMFKVVFIFFGLIAFIPSIFAQDKSNKVNLDAKAEFLAAFNNLKKSPKVRITSSANVNDKTFENIVSEYIAPNKYYRHLKKNHQGKHFEFENIMIAGQQFEKENNRWMRGSSLLLSIKEEIDLARSPKFETSKKDLFKVISLDVEYLGQEESDGKNFKIYKYKLVDEILPTEGKVWIKDGVPFRLESSTLPGCLNKIIFSVKYDYEADIVIQKPQVN